MPEILVISGKGGTGKTSLTAAFAHLAGNPIICDLDVDAPDLHLLLQPKIRESQAFYSGHEAVIDPGRCDGCYTCRQMCRFDAISTDGAVPVIDPLKCEGCKVCVELCPSGAIDFKSRHCGTWYTSETRFGPMVHAQLFPGEENSGRLVALLRQKAEVIADALEEPLIISDGPPGIGCPVISALSRVHLAVIVTEPTPSGFHDLERIVLLCEHFKVAVSVIINKYDLNAEMAGRIEKYCQDKSFHISAKLPHDRVFVHAVVHGLAVTEYAQSDLVNTLQQAWDEIFSLAIATAGLKMRSPAIKPADIGYHSSEA